MGGHPGGLGLFERGQHLAQGLADAVDLGFLDDQRRRERDDVARGADQHAAVVGVEEGLEGAARGLARDGLKLDRAA